jgi:FtsP/CotA-like multicopper oxidase with cupredoxin domain
MLIRKFFNTMFSLFVIASFILGGSGSALAQGSTNGNNSIYLPSITVNGQTNLQSTGGNGKGHGNGQMRSMTQAERLSARLNQAKQKTGVSSKFAGINPATAAYSPLAAGPSVLAAMAAPNSTPDYFGVANWANSPLPAITTSGTSTNSVVGNPLIDRAFATDFSTPPGTLAPVFVVLSNDKLPAGNLINFQVENQATTGGSPTPSAGNVFQAFVLRPTGTANQYQVIYASPIQTVPALAVAGTSETDTYTPAGLPVAVQANDMIAFYGEGVPLDTGGTNADTLSYPAPAAPAQGATITLGVDPGFPIYSTDRTYSFSATVSVGGTASTINGGIRKFVDSLPGLCNPGSALGPIPACNKAVKSIPLGVPIQFPAVGNTPASDYYEIGLVQYHEQLSSDLPAPGTLLRGYVQLVSSGTPGAVDLGDPANGLDPVLPGLWAAARPSYLGPVILAQGCEPLASGCDQTKIRPVRIKFTNLLPTGGAGDLFIPTDTTYMGAGDGPTAQGVDCSVDPKPAGCYTENRATLHLHGGNTPWISDGTPHQWTIPVGEATVSYQSKGDSAAYVPDMWFDSAGHLNAACEGQLTCPGYSNNPGQGSLTFYWTNQQSGRLMFYHDHAYGITRLNVYAGEAAGYLLSDPAEETALAAATVPGTVATDLGHLVPLILQDKSFVPDDGATGGQLAASDPTWDLSKYGGKGNLWFPHVYMPNQNPADVSGANAFGRWDYCPWFWPPQDPSTFVPQGQPFPCDSSIYSATNPPAFPPLMCPGTPLPAGVPEGFMDTMVVNGTTYPTLTVDPTAYRFQILNAGNDRTLNLGLYTADPLTIAVTSGGSGYTLPPSVVFNPATGNPSAKAVISGGAVTSYLVTGGGSGYTSVPNVSVVGDGTGATAHAVIGGTGNSVLNIVPDTIGSGYTFATVAIDPPAGCTAGCSTATANAVVTPSGSVIAINLTNPGGPWATPPAISLVNAPGDTTGNGAAAIASVNTEVKMVDAVPPTSQSALPLCGVSNPISGSQMVTAILDASGNPLNGTGLPANCYPKTWPTDGRDGGVPDPVSAGPPIIEIASEGGLLPNPVVIPSTPVGYEYNRRSITVLNVWNHGLLLGPAERADVVIDFSKFAGQTLIVYNDAPAPVPAFDPRNDYYTGDPDQTSTGGAPSTLPGYGPNTRTVMQIKVNATSATADTFSLPTLTAQLPGIFASTQQKPIVPEPANNLATQPTYVPLQSNTINAWLGVAVGGLSLTKVGAGYTAAPVVNITPGAGDTTGTGATAIAALKPTSVASFALGIGGAGYTSAPLVSLSGGGGTGASATTTLATTSVASLTINDAGRGYTGTSVPVTFTPALGGIAANANISNGRITGFTWVSHGSGYSFPTPPAATVPNPPCTPLGTNSCHRAVLTAVLAPTSVGAINWASGGSGYTSAPTVTVAAPSGCKLNGTTCVQATGTATLTPTSIASLTLTNGGTGYSTAPTVDIAAPSCTLNGTTCVQATAVASASTPLLQKTIQELFTLDYGRMNATLGVELPFTNFLTQTTIPYGFVDPPTEIFKDGEVQFWKITHNGVDTHFIHFHLFNVQVINRIGWDNAVKPPDPNEVGWKDTVRMNPLEIIIVALRPMQQNLPWKIPNSIRKLDVTQPVGAALTNEFTNVDPTNQPAAVTNDLTNFGDEYVWHCHILGHEENDMMRAMILDVPPAPPTNLASLGGGSISWVDASTNETGFTIQVAPTNTGPWTTVGTLATPGVFGPGYGSTVGNTLTFKNNAIKSGVFVRVLADNTVGYTKTYAAPAAGYPHTTASSPSAPLPIP